MTNEEAKRRLLDIERCTPIHTREDVRDFEALDMAIQALSQEPCDDAISREAVIERLKKENKVLYTPTGLDYLIRAIEGLSSVTQKSETVTEFADRCRECGAKYGKMLEQKSGKWIITYPHEKYNPIYECPCCHASNSSVFKNYCPNCGAKMVEPQESEE